MKNILIVDPEPSVLVLLDTMLAMAGFRTITVKSREEAEKICALSYVPVDLIVSNVTVETGSFEERFRALRPELRFLYLFTEIQDDMIHITPLRHLGDSLFSHGGRDGLIGEVRLALGIRAASATSE